MAVAMMSPDYRFLFQIMFWTILAMMLVLLFSLKQVIAVQRHIVNMDKNIEKMVKRTLLDEERIINDIEHPKKKYHK